MAKENCIVFPSDIRIRDVRRFCEQIHQLVEFRGYSDVLLDFANTEIFFADAALPFFCYLNRYAKDGTQFQIVLPRYSPLARLFVNTGWANLANPKQYPARGVRSVVGLPATRFDENSQGIVVDQAISLVLEYFGQLTRDHLRALEWTVNKVIDNVCNHAESVSFGFFQMSLKRTAREVQFVVADSGIGIPNSLRRGLNVTWPDDVCLEEAVKEGVTRGTGQGNGLYGSAQIAIVSGGALSINSGHGFLAIARDGRTVVRSEQSFFPGSSLDCTISFSRPLLLERALNFKGRVHVPVDYLELQFEQDDESVFYFKVKDQVRSVGSRISGRAGRNKLMNLLSVFSERKCVVDFSESGIVSSSFIDEFLVVLVQEMGLGDFTRRIHVKDLTPTNLQILARSYMQRVKRPVEEIFLAPST